ncbi:homocysteine S-methyltransferase family protein [Burkholderia multivorans]|uniref:homocysteine S-methyltransferase family protein n=1 Tax=Burkholderia multivorans TaxID=87883 RepID=UPI0018C4FF52|nr:homocysteine S-methyltransferase family protein [Burkholderia multivorans]
MAREAADADSQPVQVAGSLPPVFGSYRPDLLDAAKAAPLLNALVKGLALHVDIWLGETLSATAEAKAIHASANDDSRPLWLSFTLDDTANIDAIVRGDAGPTLRSGEAIETAFAVAASLGASGLSLQLQPGRDRGSRGTPRARFEMPRILTSRWMCTRTPLCRNRGATR